MERAYYKLVELQIDENSGTTVYPVYIFVQNVNPIAEDYRLFQIFEKEYVAQAVVNGLNKGIL